MECPWAVFCFQGLNAFLLLLYLTYQRRDLSDQILAHLATSISTNIVPAVLEKLLNYVVILKFCTYIDARFWVLVLLLTVYVIGINLVV